MTKKKTKKVGSFRAIDENGKYYTIFIYQEFFINEAFGQDTEEIPGIISLRTSTNRPVNKLDEDTYDILGNLEKIRVNRAK